MEWQDAGAALDHPDLAGVTMPKGGGNDVNPGSGAYLQYNEVGGVVYVTRVSNLPTQWKSTLSTLQLRFAFVSPS